MAKPLTGDSDIDRHFDGGQEGPPDAVSLPMPPFEAAADRATARGGDDLLDGGGDGGGGDGGEGADLRRLMQAHTNEALTLGLDMEREYRLAMVDGMRHAIANIKSTHATLLRAAVGERRARRAHLDQAAQLQLPLPRMQPLTWGPTLTPLAPAKQPSSPSGSSCVSLSHRWTTPGDDAP